ncbi:CDP-glycerol glycerophosphotransferase family protein [Lentilactobacillus sp. SPB1-3]|uniref:CDP-glycerol glycerophosphotransferase family protein n=1 Tax=Lentilactobacillus terminaliae TaxID=3003483 RepID=A0ACD5DGY1_9LACO|nr:CDP-glycerol glycerophosphotransferase family protein [Lentilactobacillus sp. SPB1-3]MCZ0977285.1 CDP-glycerol glycerophosphotransferase family protein [Lentilactobacillus sp. SPB1-3]
MSILNLFRKKRNIVYFMSFDNNVDFIKKLAAKKPKNSRLLVYYRSNTEAAATDLAAYGIITRPFKDNVSFVLGKIPKVMSARLIFCDNYYAFLGGLVKTPKMKVVQLWHANGAIKKFGWEDPTTNDRTTSDKKRFESVYDKFDDYIVSSESMGQVFERSYHAKANQMKLLGYPRSDELFDDEAIQASRDRIFRSAPELKGKRVILYAPTYREDGNFKLPNGVSNALTSDPNSIVVIKLHPVVQDREDKVREVRNPRIRFYHQFSTNDLLTVTDTLVTDYSSVVFDFSLLKNAKSVIFFMYDLERYRQDPGIQNDFLDWLPDKPLLTVKELAAAIVADQPSDFQEFNKRWNTFNDGNASDRVIEHYLQNF